MPAISDSDRAKRVFVIHGRNDAARRAVFELLRSIGLSPIEWSEAIAMTGKGSPFIGEVLDAAFASAQALVVLMTPDDIAYLRSEYSGGDGDSDTEPQAQARPNVLFEAGMAMGRDPDRTVIMELGRLRGFSDVAGRHVIRMSDTPQKRSELARRLQTAGCDVNLKGNDWMTAGDFTPPPEPGNGLPLGKRQPSTIKRVGVRLDARYHGRSGTNGQLEIVNHGPEDVFCLDVALPDDLHGLILQTAELPLRRLPAGKSLTLVCAKSMQLSSTAFDLIVTGRTTDGTILREELYVDLGA